MNTNDLGAAVLVGDITQAEVLRVGDKYFVQIKDLVLRDNGISVTTMGGHSVAVSMASDLPLSKILGGGGMYVINLSEAYIKVSAT